MKIQNEKNKNKINYQLLIESNLKIINNINLFIFILNYFLNVRFNLKNKHL